MAIAACLLGCSRSSEPSAKTRAPDKPVASGDSAKAKTSAEASDKPAASAKPPCDLPALATRYPAAERVVAIGDVHGDLAATRRALRLAGAIDAKDEWIGGKLVVVQLGDMLDRGDGEQQIVELLESLRTKAAAAGGAVHILNGNHETMNARGDYRYVTPGGYTDFEDAPGVRDQLGELSGDARKRRARTIAFAPGGPYARVFAQHNTVVIVGDTLYVHGGVLPDHVGYGLSRFNGEVRCWLAGKAKPPKLLRDPSNPLWSRAYSISTPQCGILTRTLDLLKLKRMVVAHTVQPQINAACGGKVWRIDVGMAAHYRGPTQVLELTGSGIKVLK